MRSKIKLTESAVAHLDATLKADGRDLNKRQDVWDSDLPGLLLRREPSGRRVWYMRIQVSGRKSRVKLGDFPTLSVMNARLAAKAAAGQVATGADPIAERKAQRAEAKETREKEQRAAAAILGTFVEGPYREWIEIHQRHPKATLDALKHDFVSWWKRPMADITQLDFERWRRDALKGGNKASTVNRAWERLRAVLGRAHEHGLIGPPLKVKKLKLDNRGRVRYLTTDERARLLAALDAREDKRREERARMIEWQRARKLDEYPQHGAFTDHLKPLVLLVLNSGMRRGETLGLTWGAIDFPHGMINVDAATSKSGQSRAVPMTTDARAVLEALRNQQQPTDPAVHLFTLADTGKRLQSIGRPVWLQLMASANIDGFNFHDLRHDYASRLVMAGVDLYRVSKLLGHADVSMSQRYAHLSPDYLKDAVRQLDKATNTTSLDGANVVPFERVG